MSKSVSFSWARFSRKAWFCTKKDAFCDECPWSETLAKMQPGFFCECTRVKPLCQSIIMMKEVLLIFTVFSFLGRTHFQWECYGYFRGSIKISIFKTLRRLDTTWNFAHQGLYTWARALRTLFVYTEFTKKTFWTTHISRCGTANLKSASTVIIMLYTKIWLGFIHKKSLGCILGRVSL